MWEVGRQTYGMLKGQCLHAWCVSSAHVSDEHQNKYKYGRRGTAGRRPADLDERLELGRRPPDVRRHLLGGSGAARDSTHHWGGFRHIHCKLVVYPVPNLKVPH